jgi:hypothetical protein
MPRKQEKARPRHSRPDLVKILVEEMKKTGVSDTPDVPTIYEQAQSYGDNLHVTVVWDKWAGIPPEERGAIILDAYAEAGLDEEMRRITLALGVTKEEAEKLQIDL